MRCGRAGSRSSRHQGEPTSNATRESHRFCVSRRTSFSELQGQAEGYLHVINIYHRCHALADPGNPVSDSHCRQVDLENLIEQDSEERGENADEVEPGYDQRCRATRRFCLDYQISSAAFRVRYEKNSHPNEKTLVN